MFTAISPVQTILLRYFCCVLAIFPAALSAQPAAEPFAIEAYEAPFTPVEEQQALPVEAIGSDFSASEQQLGPEPLSIEPVTVENLYVASVPVNSRSAGDRAVGLEAALSIVLARLGSGDSETDSDKARSVLQRASQLVQQYRYETPPPASDGFGPRPQQLTLRAEFSPSVVLQEMQLAGMPLWQGERPVTLLWPLVQRSGSWQLLPSDHPQRAEWRRLADARGVSLLLVKGDFPVELRKLPLIALDEQLKILGDNLTAKSNEPVRVILAEGVTQRWRQLAGLQTNWLARDEQTGLAALVDGYAKRSTVTAQTGPTITLRVDNVGSLASYAAVQRYLDALQQVQSQQLKLFAGESASFSVQLRSDAALLRSALAIDGKLQPTSEPFAYRWVAN